MMCLIHGAKGMRPLLHLALALTSLMVLAGCASNVLARKIVSAPNRQFPTSPSKGHDAGKAFSTVISQTFQVPVGPPNASLSIGVVEPGNYDLNHTLQILPGKDGSSHVDLKMTWKPRQEGSYPPQPVGTVILLHGIFMNKESMLHWALYLAASGYRSILVDLRGHGGSTGDWITYGKVETQDLVQILDDLQRRNLVTKNLAVVGLSYGAVMGIHWAATDVRVEKLVVLQPYSDISSAILGLARGNFGGVAKHFSDATFHQAIKKAPAMAGFRWQEVDVLSSVKKLKIPLLLFHGKFDGWIHPSHSEALLAVAPPGSRLGMVDDDHVTLSMRLDPVAADLVAWLNSTTAVGVSAR